MRNRNRTLTNTPFGTSTCFGNKHLFRNERRMGAPYASTSLDERRTHAAEPNTATYSAWISKLCTMFGV